MVAPQLLELLVKVRILARQPVLPQAKKASGADKGRGEIRAGRTGEIRGQLKKYSKGER